MWGSLRRQTFSQRINRFDARVTATPGEGRVIPNARPLEKEDDGGSMKELEPRLVIYNDSSRVAEEVENSFTFKTIKDEYQKWQVLPAEKCEFLKSRNLTFWRMLNAYSVSTTGEAMRCLDHAPALDDSKTFQAAVLLAMFLVSLIGNSLLIRSLAKKGKPRNHSVTIRNLIFHLGIADLLVTVTCLLGEAVWKYTVSWLADNFTCKLLKFFQIFSLYLSTFVMVLIALDQLTAVKYPMQTLKRKRACNRLVIVIYIMSLVFSSPQLIIFHVNKGPFYEEFYQCVTYGSYKEIWHEHLYTVGSIFLMFIIPLVIIISSCISMFTTLTRSEKQFRAEMELRRLLAAERNRRRLIRRAKTKSFRIFCVILVVFVICWTPYYFTMIVFQFHEPDQQLAEILQNWIFFFGMSNSLINPIIYGVFHLRSPGRDKRRERLPVPPRAAHHPSLILSFRLLFVSRGMRCPFLSGIRRSRTRSELEATSRRRNTFSSPQITANSKI